MGSSLRMVRVIDSHTAGQGTRVVVEGGPDLGTGRLSERRERLRKEFDRFRSAIVGEPRGSDALVGGLLCPPSDPTCTSAIIFFDSTGYLPMCGHGVICLMATLEYLGTIKGISTHRIETEAGVVTAQIHPAGEISIQNVESYRHQKNVTIDLNGSGSFTGDVAWGGAWFFIVNDHRQDLNVANVDRLTELTREMSRALARGGITGLGGEAVNNIALFGPARRRDVQSRNFVLRSGKTYGRSPCGTGTSAKLACLFEDGHLAEGQLWRQESLVGTTFDTYVDIIDGAIRPTIRGNAYITAESMLIIDERDPICWGLA